MIGSVYGFTLISQGPNSGIINGILIAEEPVHYVFFMPWGIQRITPESIALYISKGRIKLIHD